MPDLSFATPVRSETLDIFHRVHHTATDFLSVAGRALQEREREANCILPHALKYRDIEGGVSTPLESRAAIHDPAQPFHEQLWITVWSQRSYSSSPSLDLVATITHSEIDNLPIFLWSSTDTSQLTKSYLAPRFNVIVRSMLSQIPATRVFSVFGPNILTKSFAAAWTAATGSHPYPRPYYEAALTFVTRETLREEDKTRPARQRYPFLIRRATLADIPAVADQCYEFAYGSDFELSPDDSVREASIYVKRGQMYVCEVELPNGERHMASICAVTRNTARNATISKVHTSSGFRSMGYAETLVRRVCHRLLHEKESRFGRAPLDFEPYDAVALYVAHENIAASTVYDRVGFQGLRGKARPHGVEDVLELGFENSIKGYW
ncbi:uncharacterized protein EI90DRAFT_3016628 [Cantharellus anzutake]|uniref:uncharacterized protein n=1 Tax=Cantharellus anzutake TaxID=1750568 RepID=UPI001904A0FD|nr:uncharacterized protein EI90DRAFT_3016628 [Cantharellus anzutake]KAF8330793.1 hypothetical protein EI90DRAFT_3016628 [Cantharellus anzutake]